MNLWNNNTSQLSESFNLVQIILSIGFFLLPIFFLPFTADFLELNKAYLVMLIAVLSLFAFAFQGYKKGSLYIKGISYYLPYLALLVAGIVSIYFSTNIRNSIFGTTGNYLNSLIVLIAFVVIAFVATNIRLNVRSLINFYLAGLLVSVLVTFFGVLCSIASCVR